ncbi:hypothetical protein FP744_10009190 [Trichoderma asperellum]
MEPQFRSSASQPLNRHPKHCLQRRACIRRNQERPASINLVFAIPLDPDVQALLDVYPHDPNGCKWTTSSESLAYSSDADEDQVRAAFLDEYNSLAEQHGVRSIVAGDTTFEPSQWESIIPSQKHGWLHRIFHGASGQSAPNRLDPASRALYKRSVSDLGHLLRSRTEMYRPVDIPDMVRLTRKSVLRLPPEYAPFPLVLPTSIRATAHYIAQNANTRGLFRIPGSEKVVNSLLEYYYCHGYCSTVVSGVCRSTLPTHIPYTIHDVASTFKRFLSLMPGGILGSLPLFEIFVEIHSRLNDPSELSITNRDKVRARLIALAIETIESRLRRPLICAVFGLLNLIGRIAEISPKEHGDGRPVPANHQLMDYKALGICFGPLLIGNPCERNTMKSATSTSGLLPFSLSSKRHRRQMLKMNKASKAGFSEVKNIMLAGSVAEMLITYWRDVVYEMNDLNASARHALPSLRMPSSVSEPCITSLLVDSDVSTVSDSGDRVDQDGSPVPRTPTTAPRRERSWQSSRASGRELSTNLAYSHLSPTLEQGSLEKVCSSPEFFPTASAGAKALPAATSGRKTTPVSCSLSRSGAIRRMSSTRLTHSCSFQEATGLSAEDAPDGLTQSMSMGAIPPRISSRDASHFGVSAMSPTFEAESKNMNNGQTTFVTVREEPVEEPTHPTVRSPLSDRLRETGGAFKNLLTRKQPNRNFALQSRPLEREASMSRRQYRLLPPLFSDEELAGDDGLLSTEGRPQYLVDLAKNHPPIEQDQGNNETRLPKLISRGNIRK